MSAAPSHIAWLRDTGKRLTTPEGRSVAVLEIKHLEDAAVLSAWAKHFRQHYYLDEVLDEARDGTGLSRRDFLLQLAFPDKTNAPGPSIRAGDFAEILVADYFEYVLNWRVPRTRYRAKAIPNESVKGTDFLAFHISDTTDVHNEKYSSDDVLMSVEVKAQFSGSTPKARLQDAIDDSAKDRLRRAYTLNAMKQRLRMDKDYEGAALVRRFQSEADHPFKSQYAATAVYCETVYDENVAANVAVANHPENQNLFLIVLKGNQMMALVHHLYEVAANEA
jgi:Cap4 SAVED domain